MAAVSIIRRERANSLVTHEVERPGRVNYT